MHTVHRLSCWSKACNVCEFVVWDEELKKKLKVFQKVSLDCPVLLSSSINLFSNVCGYSSHSLSNYLNCWQVCTNLHNCTCGQFNIKSWTFIGWLELEGKKKKHTHRDFILCLYFNVNDTTAPLGFLSTHQCITNIYIDMATWAAN